MKQTGKYMSHQNVQLIAKDIHNMESLFLHQKALVAALWKKRRGMRRFDSQCVRGDLFEGGPSPHSLPCKAKPRDCSYFLTSYLRPTHRICPMRMGPWTESDPVYSRKEGRVSTPATAVPGGGRPRYVADTSDLLGSLEPAPSSSRESPP